MPKRASSAALFTSASSKTMTGDLPPNSSETCFKLLLAAERIISRPTSVEPVKLTYTCTNHKSQSYWFYCMLLCYYYL